MKYKSILICSCFFSLISPLTAKEKVNHKQRAVQHYQTALNLEKSGDVDQAIAHLRKAIKHHPDFIKARQRLTILIAKAPDLKKKQIVNQWNSVIIPEVTFVDASFEKALAQLKESLKKADKKKLAGCQRFNNTVIVDPNKKLKDARINLKLRNVPFGVALDNLMLQARCQYSIDKYVITFRPRS